MISLRASSPIWVSEGSLVRTRPLAAAPLARAFSRDSLRLPKEELARRLLYDTKEIQRK